MTILRQSQAKVKKARAVELFDEGVDTSAVASRLGVPRPTVVNWHKQWIKSKENTDE